MTEEKKTIDAVTNSVMDVYKKVNPSFVEGASSEEDRRRYQENWREFVIKKLKLPPLVFQGRTLLDIGCGSGEKSLVYASLGAKVLGLDVNEKTIALAQQRAVDWKGSIKGSAEFRVCSVFDVEVGQTFDIVISDGMIHHTADPKKAFDNFAKLVNPGGVLVLGLAESCGFLQRQLQRYFVNKIAGTNEENTKVAVAMALFEEKLQRASKASGRSVRSTVYDSFVNPQVVPIPFQDVRTWMAEHDIYLDCTWPPAELPLQGDSQYHPPLEPTDPSVAGWENLCRIFWMLNDQYDKDRFGKRTNCDPRINEFLAQIPSICSDASLNTNKLGAILESAKKIDTNPLPGSVLQEDFEVFIKEILKKNEEIDLLKSQGLGPQEIAKKINFKRLFSGFSGVGMVYYRGTKAVCDQKNTAKVLNEEKE